jgi:hypothetical protein
VSLRETLRTPRSSVDKGGASDKHTRAFALWETSSFGMGLRPHRQCQWREGCVERAIRGSYCELHGGLIYAGKVMIDDE